MNKLLIAMGIFIVGFVAFVYMFPIDEEIRDSRVISNCWDEELKICKMRIKAMHVPLVSISYVLLNILKCKDF